MGKVLFHIFATIASRGTWLLMLFMMFMFRIPKKDKKPKRKKK